MEKVFDTIVVGAGQAGLAAAYHLQQNGLQFLVLEASKQTAGSWPHYYDSLTLFSPARFSSLPGLKFPGDGDRYPHKDEVISYLIDYAKHFQFPIQTGVKVTDIKQKGSNFEIVTSKKEAFFAKTLISATGAFSSPYIPKISNQDLFQGEVIHSYQYKNEQAYQNKRIVIVGGGNSAVQIGYELAQFARVSLATRKPISFVPQVILGKDVHFWFDQLGIDRFSFTKSLATKTNVLDRGIYKEAIANNKPDQRPMFTSFTEKGVIWDDGQEEEVDVVIFATGYRYNMEYLTSLQDAVDEAKNPIHNRGISETVPGLYYVGLAGQRNFASATLRGVGADAKYVVKHLINQWISSK